jgi:DNA-directed RNA polymerase specialized sigma24 family protein
MQANSGSRNAATAPLPVAGFDDVWGPEKKWRVILDPSGARTTFTFDRPSHTVMQSPRGARVTLTWCESQSTVEAAQLSHFAAHVEFRAQAEGAHPERPADLFLGHHESQRRVTVAAAAILRSPSKCRRWLEDVIQQANRQLLDDLRQRRAVFQGDDPELFARWFRATSRNVVIDAIKLCLRKFTALELTSATRSIADPNTLEPADVAIVREIVRLVDHEISQIRETMLREVMLDLRDGQSTRDSASRLNISKSKVGRMQGRGCRLIAARFGK